MYESLIIWLTKLTQRGLLAVDSDAVLVRLKLFLCSLFFHFLRAGEPPSLGSSPLGNPHEKRHHIYVMAFRSYGA